jgi:hypothetical protein
MMRRSGPFIRSMVRDKRRKAIVKGAARSAMLIEPTKECSQCRSTVVRF